MRNKFSVIHKIAVTILMVTAFSFLYQNASSQNILADQLQKHVLRITGTKAPRNYRNRHSLDTVATYIQEYLKADNYVPLRQIYQVGDTAEYFNVICRYGDTLKPRIILGAHYDVCENQPGADDNASGVAGLLEIASLLSRNHPKLDYCIEMVFYTLEEPPFFRTTYMGSYIHADYLRKNNIKVTGMVSMEMIGYYSDEPNSQQFPAKILEKFYPDKGNFIAVVGKKGMRSLANKFKRGIRSGSDIPVEMLIAPASMTGVDFSDHMNYWNFGFRAIMITDTAFMRNKNYHRKTDKPETLNYVKMAEVVKGIYYTLINY